jgi:hypothetical protein
VRIGAFRGIPPGVRIGAFEGIAPGVRISAFEGIAPGVRIGAFEGIAIYRLSFGKNRLRKTIRIIPNPF